MQRHGVLIGLFLVPRRPGAAPGPDQQESGLRLKVRKPFFSEEKNQKTFVHAPAHRAGCTKSKSFLVLFFKKERLPASPCRPLFNRPPIC
jgi:hypothetical protein